MMLSFGEAMRAAGAGVELLRERLQSGVSYNPLSSRTAQDPYPVYAALRTRDPVHRSRLLKAWLFTRHADVDAILRDHRHFGNHPRTGTLSSRQHAMLPPADEFTMLFLDPPDHTRLRALVNKAFTRKAVDDLEPRIRGILETLLDDIEDLAGFDLMQAVARPLPVIVIAEMLGVPPQDRERFRIWSAQRARLLEPMIGPREREAGEAASRAFDAYFRPIIEPRRAEPRDDIVSALARAEDDGARLSERETLNMLRLLLIAGNETTVNLIGNGMLALLRHPEQLQRLRNDPTGTGVEMGAGLSYAAGPLTVEGQVRMLVAHEESGYEEWGASGAMRITPSASGRGLTLSIAPQWGRTGSATEQLWSARDATALGTDRVFEGDARLAVDAGYGVGVGHGVLTPYAGLTLGDAGNRTVRTGMRCQVTPDAVFGLEATRQTSDAAEAANEARLRAALRF